MSIGFFIVGGIIFAVYLYLTFWNIFHSSKKQRQENYPNIPKVKQGKKWDYVEKVLTKH